MLALGLCCVNCNQKFPLEALYECSNCNGILEVDYNYELDNSNNSNIDALSRYLPVRQEHLITLGEGNTPLIEAKRLSERLGLKKLYFKNEFMNPTGSFKDRPVSMGISKAVELGYRRVIVASSGNGAAAVSAYAARAGLEAYILVPDSTPDEKVKQALAYGGKVVKVEGPYSNSFSLAKEVGLKFNMFNLTSTFINPYTVEGDKLISYEMEKQLSSAVPDYIIVPIGAGPLLVGIYKGYKELFQLNKVSKLPKMVGIQAEGCSPIAKAYLSGESTVVSEQDPKTIAGGICDGLYGYEKDGTHTLNIIKESGGFANYTTDSQILEAAKWLAEDEGLFVEPASASGIAGLAKSIEEERISKNSRVVVLLTGHGLKDMKRVQTNFTAPVISKNSEKLIEIINS